MEKKEEITDKEIAKILIDLAVEFGKEKGRCMFVITEKNIEKHYKLLYPNLFEGKNVNIKDKDGLLLAKKLAELDGAVVVNEEGKLLAFGAMITRTRIYRRFGTIHSAALGISRIPGVIAITASEEDGCVRIFREGITLVEINPLTKTPPTLSEKIADMITSTSIPVIGGGGLASLALGLNPFVAAIVFTGSYIATKGGIQSLSEFLKSGKLWKKRG